MIQISRPNAITPESLPAPPRRVRGRLGGGIWFTRLFMLPHTLVGIGLIGYLVLMLLWWLFGTDLPAIVTDRSVYQSRKHGPSYTLSYQFQANGETKYGSGGTSLDLYQLYQTHSLTNPPVTVRYFSLGPLTHCALLTGRPLWHNFSGVLIAAIGWNALISFFVYRYWIVPLRTRRLYRNGEAIRGTVLSKREQTGKGSTYYVTYSFRAPASGQVFEKEILVWNPAIWQTAAKDKAITVLYSRDNPKYSTAYEFGGYYVDETGS